MSLIEEVDERGAVELILTDDGRIWKMHDIGSQIWFATAVRMTEEEAVEWARAEIGKLTPYAVGRSTTFVLRRDDTGEISVEALDLTPSDETTGDHSFLTERQQAHLDAGGTPENYKPGRYYDDGTS